MRIVLIWTYCAVYKEEYASNLLALVNLLSWFRALSYLRLFKSTRVLIRLIVEVSKDMVPFMIVLSFSLVGFTLSFKAIGF